MKRFKLILKSLINNDACVEGGRKHPWWIALIIYFLSMVLALIPVFVQTITKKGSSAVSQNTNGMEVFTQRFAEDISDKGLIMEVKEQNGEKYLSLDQQKWNETYTWQDERGYNAYHHLNENGEPDFDVYYMADLQSSDVEKMLSNVPVRDEEGNITHDKKGNEVWNKRRTSFIVFGSKELAVYNFNRVSGAQVGALAGDYKHYEVGFKINDLTKVSVDGVEYDYTTITPELFSKYHEGAWNNWLKFFDDAYLYQRGQLTWKTTLLMFGINTALVLFMGLMIFVLTRGKHNPFRIYTIFECMWIACWASLTPAILTSGLGFLIKSFSQIIFPLLLGLRVMWLSMKSLRPDYNVPQQSSSKNVKTVNTKPVK